jgi:hypothetical protein
VEAVINNAPLGADTIEGDKAEPSLDDVVKGMCRDLVVCNSGPSAPGCTAPGDAFPAPRFSGVY